MSGTEARSRALARVALGLVLIFAGTAHLSVQREEFRAQVPEWFPVDDDAVVVVSGVAELMLGLSVLFARRRRAVVGVAVAGFFVIIFPGNIAQFIEKTDAFGLDTDAKRLTRLFFQPLLVAWALWCTDGYAWLRGRFR